MTCPPSTTLTQACNVAVTMDGAPLPSGSITNVTWDWGDGHTDANQTSPVKTRTYLNAGTYTVFASVTGAPPLATPQTSTVSQTITVPSK
jgi:PKD repeat protein